MIPPLVADGPPLTAPERQRYARQLTLPSLGEEGQRRLKGARVLCVGAGGLGSPALLYLAAAGVGTLGIVDDDRVDVSNLQRQVLFATRETGQPKVDAAVRRIAEANPLVTVRAHPFRLDRANAVGVLGGYDVILDGSDNFATRYLVADAADILRKPVVWGALLREVGQVSVFWPGQGPAYRDVFPDMPDPATIPSCAEAGVVGATCGVIGATMAAEAIKLITGSGRSLLGRLLVHDALAGTWREFTLVPDPEREFADALAESYDAACELPGRPAVEAQELRALLSARERGAAAFTLLDVRTDLEREQGVIPGSVAAPCERILEGTLALPSADRYIVYCHSGVRSARVVDLLTREGHRADNLRGGIRAWWAASGWEVAPAAPEGR